MKTEMKAVENKTASPMYVGNVMIPPGETKVVEVPLTRKPPVEAPPAGPDMTQLVAELLDLSVPKIKAQLPGLTNEALDLMEQAEQAGKTRVGVIDAIAAERLHRANAKLQAQEDADKAKTLAEARNALLQARVALQNLPPTATEDERTVADQAVAEAQAKVDVLEHPEG